MFNERTKLVLTLTWYRWEDADAVHQGGARDPPETISDSFNFNVLRNKNG